MKDTVRQKKMARLVQRELSNILQANNRQWVVEKEWVTIIDVHMSPDLSMAKVYISIMLTPDKEVTLKKINLHKGEIRKALGTRIGKQARLVPELVFFIDDVEENAMRIESLIAKLNIPPIGDDKIEPA